MNAFKILPHHLLSVDSRWKVKKSRIEIPIGALHFSLDFTSGFQPKKCVMIKRISTFGTTLFIDVSLSWNKFEKVVTAQHLRNYEMVFVGLKVFVHKVKDFVILYGLSLSKDSVNMVKWYICKCSVHLQIL